MTKAGRYAVRIEGAAPTTTRSSDDPTIPAARKMFELHPRLFVETLEGPGRMLLHDFVTEVGTIGMPADSRGVLTVVMVPGQLKVELQVTPVPQV